jgi:hypothetical protein
MRGARRRGFMQSNFPLTHMLLLPAVRAGNLPPNQPDCITNHIALTKEKIGYTLKRERECLLFVGTGYDDSG